jgi:hypothetical protein
MGASVSGATPVYVSGVPQLETLEVELCTTKVANVDSLEVLYGIPEYSSGTTVDTGLHECISPSSPTTTTTPVPATVRLVEAFDISPPGATVPDIFTYFTFQASKFVAVSTAYAGANPTQVAAIGINITFLPAPGDNSKQYHTELGTTVQTEVFLRNSSQA